MDMKTTIDFKQKVKEAAEIKFGIPLAKAAQERIDKELHMIQTMGYEQELILIAELIRSCRIGGYWPYHRTPIGASLVAYLLGIVKSNPLNHKLFPELAFGLGEKKSLWALSVPRDMEQHFCSSIKRLCREQGFTLSEEDAQYVVQTEHQTIYIEYNPYGEMIWAQRGEVWETREALFAMLLRYGMNRQMAYDITEYVRKGKAFSQGVLQEHRDAMLTCGISQELIDALKKIQYLPSEAVLLQQHTTSQENTMDNQENTAEELVEEQPIYWYVSLGVADIDTSRRFNSRLEAKAAAEKVISRVYRVAENLFIPGEHSLAKDYGMRYAIRVYDKYYPFFEEDDDPALHSEEFLALLNGTSDYFSKALNEELRNSSGYYRLYEKGYFLDRVSIEEHDFTVDAGDGGFFNSLFRLVSPDRDYTAENVIETVIELEEDVNCRVNTFSKAVFEIYQEYCEKLEKAREAAKASPQE